MTDAPARPVHVRPLGHVIGEATPLTELADPEVAARLDQLEGEGITGAVVSGATSAELAAQVVSSSGGRAVVDGVEPDVVVVCTDTLEGVDPTDWMTRFQHLSGTELTTTMMVSGHACANLVLGLETCRGLIASGVADTALLVTADRVPSGTRFTGVSGSVYGDGAAACLVSTEPGRSLEILGSGMRGQEQVRADASSMKEARKTLLAMSAARDGALAGRPADVVRHVLSPRLGHTARSLLAMAASVPAETVRTGTTAEQGHCFSVDVLMGCEQLLDDPACRPGDGVLVLVSGRHVQSAMLLARSTD